MRPAHAAAMLISPVRNDKAYQYTRGCAVACLSVRASVVGELARNGASLRWLVTKSLQESVTIARPTVARMTCAARISDVMSNGSDNLCACIRQRDRRAHGSSNGGERSSLGDPHASAFRSVQISVIQAHGLPSRGKIYRRDLESCRQKKYRRRICGMKSY